MADEQDQEIENIDEAWAAALEEQQKADEAREAASKIPQAAAPPPPKPDEAETARASQPDEAESSPPSRPEVGLDLLLRIPVEVRIRLGETELLVHELLQLGQGSIVELDKLAGEDLDLLVNDRLMGKGEVVVVNDHFGLRIKEIISPKERIEELG